MKIKMRVWPRNNEEIMLLLTVIATFFAAISAIFSYMAIQDAKESTILSEQNVNKTTEIAKWYYEPQPQMNIWSSVDYELKEFGVVYISEWYEYTHGNGGFRILNDSFSDFGVKFGNYSTNNPLPSYWSCCKNINIIIYNSGRESIVFPLISFDIEAKNKTERVNFKVHTIRTPIDKLVYDPVNKLMYESQESIENQQIWMPYGYLTDTPPPYDFPPYLDENGNSYFLPTSFSEKYSTKLLYMNPHSDILGPFNIGTIQSGGTAAIDLKIFATENNCTEGFLNITIQALNTKKENRSIRLKTSTKMHCYNYTAESEERMKASTR